MAIDYAEIAQNALEAIADAGAAWPIVRITKTFDPVLSEDSDPVKVTGSAMLVVVPFNSKDVANMDDNLKEAYTLNKLRKCILAAQGLTFPPLPGDWLPTLQGECYKIEAVTPLCITDVPLIYYAIAEKTAMSDQDKAAVEES